MEKPAILMVDIDADDLNSSTLSLEENGFKVCSVNSTEAFADALKHCTPEVIVVKTYSGAPITGHIMQEISNNNHFKHLPVVYHFADEDIYLVKRKIDGGRMEYRSVKADNMESVLRNLVHY